MPVIESYSKQNKVATVRPYSTPFLRFPLNILL